MTPHLDEPLAGSAPLSTRRRPGRSKVSVAVVLAVVMTGLLGWTPPANAASAVDLFADSLVPSLAASPSSRSREVGVEFSTARAGTISALQFYRGAQQKAGYTGSLWDENGTRLARVDFPASTTVGWQTTTFAPPVPVKASQTYVASNLATEGRYPVSRDWFAASYSRSGLTVPANGGVSQITTTSVRPTSRHSATNYLVDVRFTPSASPTDPDPVAELDREPWWGGPAYYAKFPRARASGWADPDFFPIAVFLGKPEHATSLRSIGVNTYMGAEHDGSAMSTITRTGMSVLAQNEWTPAEVGNDQRVVGWNLSDECEMGYSGCPEGESQSLAMQRSYARIARARNDGRFLQANFGNGVLGTYWAPTTMDDHLALLDVSSVDKYAYTSPHVQGLLRQNPYWKAGRNPASAQAYGWLQDRMATFTQPPATKPNWVFVETAKPYLTEAGATTINPDQIKGAAWNALIHGAAGIAYFQHNNNRTCGNYSLIDCPTARTAVTQLNQEITQLAPVLNSPTLTWNFGPGLDTSLKNHNNTLYILAMTDGGTGTRTLTLPPGTTATQIDVIGENRTLRVSGRTFSDSFPSGSTHHVYRVVR